MHSLPLSPGIQKQNGIPGAEVQPGASQGVNKLAASGIGNICNSSPGARRAYDGETQNFATPCMANPSDASQLPPQRRSPSTPQGILKKPGESRKLRVSWHADVKGGEESSGQLGVTGDTEDLTAEKGIPNTQMPSRRVRHKPIGSKADFKENFQRDVEAEATYRKSIYQPEEATKL